MLSCTTNTKKLENVVQFVIVLLELKMSVFEGVIREEVERLSSNIAIYEEKLANLPRGSLFIRKNGNSYFAYRKRRDGKKIISIYLGQLDSEKAQEEIDKSNEYKRIKQNLKIAKQELNELKRAIKIYDRKRAAS